MIYYLEGDIFQTPAQVIVDAVNTVGVMGKGIALEFKKRYPDMFNAYREACEKGLFKMGNLMYWNTADHILLLFPTKTHWRYPSKLEYIETGLKRFTETYHENGILSVAFPKLGCGNGDLDWNLVKPLMVQYLNDLPLDVYIYLNTFNDTVPEHYIPSETVSWFKRNAKDLSFFAIQDDIISNFSLIPLEFPHRGSIWKMQWNGVSLCFTETDSNTKVEVSEDRFFMIWDYARNNEVIKRKETDSDDMLVLSMLCALGYITPVKIYDYNGIFNSEGYQINSGTGRSYVLSGGSDGIS